MAGLFSVTKEGDILLDKEVLRLCPLLNDITLNELKYLIFSYDYNRSPAYRKPLEERKLIAKRKYLSEDKEPEKSTLFIHCIDEYESLIYDAKKHTLEMYKTKAHRLDKLVAGTDNPKEITDYDKALTIVTNRIVSLEAEIVIDEESIELRGGKKLSYIEQLKKNRRLYQLQKPDTIYTVL